MNSSLAPLAFTYVLLSSTIAAVPAARADAPAAFWRPQQAFAQVGVAEEASAAVFGTIWKSDWDYPLAGGRLNLYWEASLGRWIADREDGSKHSSWTTQLGVTPVLRWYPQYSGGPRWFVEGGIGANVLLPIYRSREKRFSTTFNFGDHLAVGAHFGDASQYEVALRIQHFSNGGIKHPNPGENFLQLRLACLF